MSKLDDLTDSLNPLLVKEGRQILKSRQFAICFLILLGVAWLLALDPQIQESAAVSQDSGRRLFQRCYMLLATALCLPVPFSAFHSSAFERRDLALQMLQITPLAARGIVRGKFQVVLIQAGLYVAALVPFMCFAYLLRGIGMIEIVGLTLELVFVTAALAMFGLLMGVVSRTPFRQVVAMAAMLAAVVLTGSICVALGESQQVAAGICIVLPAGCVFLVCRETTISLVELQPPRSPIRFIGLKQLELLSVIVREIASVIRHSFPLEGNPLSPTMDVQAFLQAHARVRLLVRQLNFVLNRSILVDDPTNFVSYDLAEPVLREVRTKINMLMAAYGWDKGFAVYEEFKERPWRQFPTTSPEAFLEPLEAAAAELERLGPLIRNPVEPAPVPVPVPGD